MDPFTISTIYVGLSIAIIALGVALIVAPVRTTGALNEWFVVVPAAGGDRRLPTLVVRGAGSALLVFGLTLLARAVALVVSW